MGAVVPRPGGPRTLRRAAGAHRVAAAAAAAAAAVVLHRAGPGRAGGAERRGCASPGLCAAGGGGAAGCGRWRRRRVKGNGGDGCYGVSWGQRRGGSAARREQEGPWRAVLGTRRERCDAGGRWEAQLGAHEAPSGGTGEQSCGDAMLGSAAGQGRPCGGAGKRHWGHRGGDAVLGGQRGRAGGSAGGSACGSTHRWAGVGAVGPGSTRRRGGRGVLWGGFRSRCVGLGGNGMGWPPRVGQGRGEVRGTGGPGGRSSVLRQKGHRRCEEAEPRDPGPGALAAEKGVQEDRWPPGWGTELRQGQLAAGSWAAGSWVGGAAASRAAARKQNRPLVLMLSSVSLLCVISS